MPINAKSLNKFPVPIIDIDKSDTRSKQEKVAISLIRYLFSNYNKMYHNISQSIQQNNVGEDL